MKKIILALTFALTSISVSASSVFGYDSAPYKLVTNQVTVTTSGSNSLPGLSNYGITVLPGSISLEGIYQYKPKGAFSAVAATTIAKHSFSPLWSVGLNALGGFNLTNEVLTGGYELGIAYTYKSVSLAAGWAQLYQSAGVPGQGVYFEFQLPTN